MEKQTRAHVIIKGRVQGVFFRAETQRAAERIGVCGWVRNKSDGTVEAVFEGADQKVAQVLEWCRQGSPMSKVSDVVVDYETPSGEYTSFRVTY